MRGNHLKLNLLDKLIAVRDLTLLEKIDRLIGEVDPEKPIFHVTDSQGRMLRASEEDLRRGRLKDDKDLNKEEDEWLNA